MTPESFLLLPPEDQSSHLASLPTRDAAAILREADSRSVIDAIRLLGAEKSSPILRDIPPDDLADLAIHASQEDRDAILHAVGDELAAEVRKLLEFPADTAGGLMTTRYASVPDVVTAGRAAELVRAFAKVEAVNYVYAVDAGGKLTGTVPIRGLLLAHPNQPLKEIVSPRIVKLPARARREDVVRSFRENHYLALPVVDDHERLIGVVTADDALAAARDQADELLYSATGVDAREPVMHTLRAARSRIPWISVTLLGGLGCAVVAGLFRHTLEKLVIVGIFLPIVLGIGEAVAAQTTSLVMKTLVAGEVPRGALRRFLLKEVTIGFLLGLYCGSIVGIVSYLYERQWTMGVAIGVAIFASVTWATLLSVAVPSLLRRMRFEPTVASGPVVLTIADLSTLAIYFTSAAIASS